MEGSLGEILKWLLNQGAAIVFLALAVWWFDKRYTKLEEKHETLQNKYEIMLTKAGENQAVDKLVNHLVGSEGRIIEAILKMNNSK